MYLLGQVMILPSSMPMFVLRTKNPKRVSIKQLTDLWAKKRKVITTVILKTNLRLMSLTPL